MHGLLVQLDLIHTKRAEFVVIEVKRCVFIHHVIVFIIWILVFLVIRQRADTPSASSSILDQLPPLIVFRGRLDILLIVVLNDRLREYLWCNDRICAISALGLPPEKKRPTI